MLKMTTKHTAILLFANSSSEEIKQKKIIKGMDLFKHLNDKISLEAQKTGLDVMLYSEEIQKGNSFGERFANAIESVFLKGYQHVITIGNDSPDLRAHHLTTAAKNLQKNILTLGPSLDGGTYLITLSKQQFNKEQFIKLPWQTSKLLHSLERFLVSKHTTINKLTPLKDIDSFTDIHFFISRFKKTTTLFKSILLSLVFSLRNNFFSPFFFYKEIQLSFPFNKGSPFVI